MATQQCLYIREETNPVTVGFDPALEYNIGDIVAFDAAGLVVSGADFTWDTDLATTQTNFAAALAGHTPQYKKAGDTQVYGNGQAEAIVVSTSGTYLAPLQSATTFKPGEFVGLAKNPSSNHLLSQVFVKVADINKAVGVVVEPAVSATQVYFRLLPAVLPFAR